MNSEKQLILRLTSRDDFIHDLSYDYFGERLAVAFSSQRIEVHRFFAQSNEWELEGTIANAHDGPVWKVSWGPPEFGPLLASCSDDRTVCIWSEVSDEASIGTSHSQQRIAGGGTPPNKCRWIKRAKLSDAQGPVWDVRFSPVDHGLCLASCSSDGVVRLYHISSPVNLASWPLDDSFSSHRHSSSAKGCTSICWHGNAEVACLAVAGFDGSVLVWRKAGKTWTRLAAASTTSLPLRSVAWAPNLCRPYDILVTSGDAPEVVIWGLSHVHHPIDDEDPLRPPPVCDLSIGPKDVFLNPLQRLALSPAPIWRAAFNITGTLLSASSSDGAVAVWRQDDSSPPLWLPTEFFQNSEHFLNEAAALSSATATASGGGGATAIPGGGSSTGAIGLPGKDGGAASRSRHHVRDFPAGS